VAYANLHIAPDEDEGTAYMGSMAIVGAHGQAMMFAYIPRMGTRIVLVRGQLWFLTPLHKGAIFECLRL